MHRLLRCKSSPLLFQRSRTPSRYLSTAPTKPPVNTWLAGGIGMAVVAALMLYFKSKKRTNSDNSPTRTASSAATSSVDTKEFDPQTWALPDLPGYAQYLLVGGGTASHACAEEILKNDPRAKILILTEESYPPYRRPPLSKYLWASDDPELIRSLKYAFGTDEYSILYSPLSSFSAPSSLTLDPPSQVLALATGHKVTAIDSQKKLVTLENGWEIFFDKCLLATGGNPRNLPVFSADVISNSVSTYRSARDFLSLEQEVRGRDVLLVGGGFLGSELSVALAQKRARGLCGRVLQVFPEAGNMGLVFPRDLSRWATERVSKEGVEVYPGRFVDSVYRYRGRLHAVTSEGEELVVDRIVVAVGLEPNTQLSESGEFEVDMASGGYKVNQEMQVRSDIWAAGDVSSFFDPLLGRRRVEHHDHAMVSGRIAGENMSRPGARVAYSHQSMFWSDIGPDVAYEAIGLCDSRLPTVSFWRTNGYAKPGIAQSDHYGKGLVFYLKEGVISGIIAMNLKNRIEAARQVLSGKFTDEDFEEVVRKMKLFEDK